MKSIESFTVKGKRVLLRVDFNITLLKKEWKIADDARIRQALPTITHLLSNNNRLILVSHLGRPDGKRNKRESLRPVADHLSELLGKKYTVKLIDDFTTQKGRLEIENQKVDEVMLLENIRFYPGEEKNDPNFAKKLADLADVFVNDGFGVSHRAHASVTGVCKYLPSYAGFLLTKEVETIKKLLLKPKKPVVAIIGGAKISTKVVLLSRLCEITDYILIGGALANTFFLTQGFEVGKSLVEKEELESAKRLLFLAAQKKATVILPDDALVASDSNAAGGEVVKVEKVPKGKAIFDIGPETKAKFGKYINNAKTIIWNGPVGYCENPSFSQGTDFLYYAIAHNDKAFSIVGGGDTLAAISNKEYLDRITHISTGGGAMLELIEKGTLPGIDALE